MSVTKNNILYTRIESTNTACVGTENGSINAVPSSFVGEVNILPNVLIDKIKCVVTVIGKYAFKDCAKITRITIPNTIKTLKIFAFRNISLESALIIPCSIVRVESWFIDYWKSYTVIFCGVNEPEKVIINSYKSWMSNYFTGRVIVPLNYKEETFCLKNIERNPNIGCIANCKKTKYCVKNQLSTTSYIIIFLLLS